MMITLRLFRDTDPFRQLESRALDEGELTIGRDPAADWPIDDPDRALSRRHCVVAVHDGRLTLRDTSSNGVFWGPERERLVPGEPRSIEAGEAFRLGGFMIVVDKPAAKAPRSARPDKASPKAGSDAGFDAPFSQPMLQPMDVTPEALTIPTDWTSDAPQPKPAPTDGSLLAAFCAGARLEPTAFSGEDALEVMHRLGGVYQQMVLGLGDLMSERTSAKAEYRMERTTIGAQGNNPFKWARADRLAVDLLLSRQDGFLSGREAVKASFVDLKKHLLCMLAGLRAALGASLDGLDPERVEEGLRGQPRFLTNKAAAAWAEYERLYEAFRQQADADPNGPINRAFKTAYEKQLRALDDMGGEA